jgi:hypothetical protein
MRLTARVSGIDAALVADVASATYANNCVTFIVEVGICGDDEESRCKYVSRYATLDLFNSKTIEGHRVFQSALLVM